MINLSLILHQLEKIWKSEYSLQEFLDPKNFKSYDELKAKLNRVLGLDGSSNSNTRADEIEIESAPVQKAAPAPAFAAKTDDDDDSMSFFEKLAAED